MNNYNKILKHVKVIVTICIVIAIMIYPISREKAFANSKPIIKSSINLNDIPEYQGKSFVVVNNNKPTFKSKDVVPVSYESYGALDDLGRCTTASACIGIELMPTEPRESLGNVVPTGWHTIKYDCVEGKYLYNRCHLLGYQLTGENANRYNLITGTRYMNVNGMWHFEEMVADYIKETRNHVMYRVTPVFEGENLVASGVQMEAKSVEDNGSGISFNVFVYNVQPGIIIDYSNGESCIDEEYFN